MDSVVIQQQFLPNRPKYAYVPIGYTAVKLDYNTESDFQSFMPVSPILQIR